MTVCIAGLAENSKSVVLASDNMITKQMPPVEYEHKELPKIEKIYDGFYVMLAGTINNAVDIIDLIKNNLRKDISLAEKFEDCKNIYKNMRQMRINDDILSRHVLASAGEFYSLQTRMNGNIALQIQSLISSFSLGVDMILIGEEDGHFQIRILTNPGELINPLEYAIIGSGNIQAAQSLIVGQYSAKDDVNTSAYLVFEAKKKAEITPGVGEMTDMIVLAHDDKNNMHCKKFTDDDLSKLKRVYDDLNMRQPKTIKQKLKEHEFDVNNLN